MRFTRFGKTYQLSIETAQDLREALSLDESLWVATSVPTDAFRCDPKAMELMDADGDGRIQTDDLKRAIEWMFERLANPKEAASGKDVLPLSAIRDDTKEGQALIEAATYVLETLGADDRSTISIGKVREFLATVQKQPMNGDGIITPAAAHEKEIAAYIDDILLCRDGTQDAGGEQGIAREDLDEFDKAVSAFLQWQSQAPAELDGEGSDAMPLGAKTPELYALFSKHAGKVDQFFALCRLARFEPRVEKRIAGPESTLEALNTLEVEAVSAYLESAPIAPPTTQAELPLSVEQVNPSFREWIADLCDRLLPHVLGTTPATLDPKSWGRVKAAFATYETYLNSKQGALVETLPADKLTRYKEPSFCEKVAALIEEDRRVAQKLERIRELERLLLYRKHLMNIANNFISFPHLYAPGERAMFEMGSALLDGRWFNFAVPVENPAQHRKIAKLSSIFVMYLEVGDQDGKKYTVAVPATSGTKGNLAVGKRGVFFDTNSKEYDAHVIHVIDNPISLREALVAPFVRLWQYAEGKVEAWSGSAEKGLIGQFDQSQKTIAQSGNALAGVGTAKPGLLSGAATPLIGLSIAAAALGSALAFITKTFAGLSKTGIVLGLLGAALAVMLPMGVVALLKLRRQDLSALLEGCGWAINARMRLDRKQRRYFTRTVPYPRDAKGTPSDPRWWLLVAALLIAALLIMLAGLGSVKRPTHDTDPIDSALDSVSIPSS